MAGAAATVDVLKTFVTMHGVETMTKQQAQLAAGYQAVAAGAAKADAGMASNTGAMTKNALAAGAVLGISLGVLNFYRNAAKESIKSERSQVQFNTALKNNGLGKYTDELNSYTEQLGAAGGKTPFGDEQMKNAASMLSTFKFSKDEIKQFLPLLADTAVGMRSANGEFKDVGEMAKMFGKAIQSGNVGMLKRMGVVVDSTAIKLKGFKTAAKDALTQKFGGQAAAYMDTTEGSMVQLADAWEELKETIGTGVLGPLKSVNKVLSGALNFLNKADTLLGGWPSQLGFITAGFLAIGSAAKLAWMAIEFGSFGGAGNLAKAAAARFGGAAAASAAGSAAGTIAGAVAAGGASAAGGAVAGAGGTVAAGGLLAGAGVLALPAALIATTVAAAYSVWRTGSEATAAWKETGAAGRRASDINQARADYLSASPDMKDAIRRQARDTSINATGIPNSSPEASKQTELLQKINEVLQSTHNAIIGGGARTRGAINQGDIRRAFAAEMGGQLG